MLEGILLVGNHQRRLDDEGRVSVPPEFRRKFSPYNQSIHYMVIPLMDEGINYLEVNLTTEKIHPEIVDFLSGRGFMVPEIHFLPYLDPEGRMNLGEQSNHIIQGQDEEVLIIGNEHNFEIFSKGEGRDYLDLMSRLALGYVHLLNIDIKPRHNNPPTQSYRHS
tara:strand:- start:1795 stop:2286 length:492 start_codon:yes stop_codon:yes gene_type:complete